MFLLHLELIIDDSGKMRLHSAALSLVLVVVKIWPARAADGEPPPRLEINDIFESGPQWYLIYNENHERIAS